MRLYMIVDIQAKSDIWPVGAILTKKYDVPYNCEKHAATTVFCGLWRSPETAYKADLTKGQMNSEPKCTI